MILASTLDWRVAVAMFLLCIGVGYSCHLIITYLLSKVASRKAGVFLTEKKAAAQVRITQARQRALQETSQLRQAAMVEIEEDRENLKELERRLHGRAQDFQEKEEILKTRREDVESFRREVKSQEGGLRQIRRKIGKIRAEGRKVLLRILDTTDEALRQDYLKDVGQEVERELRRWQEQQAQLLEEEADTRARNIVSRVVQRMQISHTREDRPAGIEVSGTDVLEKNGLQVGSPLLAAFQDIAQVEVHLDAETGNLNISTMDGVRREVATRALTWMLGLSPAGGGSTDAPAGKERKAGRRSGRSRGANRGMDTRKENRPKAWTPNNIRILIERIEQDLKRVLNRKGRKATQDLKLSGNNKLFDCLGRLSFRTSFGQNILSHSQEVGFLGGLLGAEVGLDIKMTKRCAFLHDIGKSIDYEMEGGHPEIGGKMARECGECDIVINAIEAHHEDVARSTSYPLIVQAADAISGARPGARRRTAEKYLIRMGQIEEIATNKPGVESAYVIQAGREVRVILDAEKTSDEDADKLADTISRELEAEMNFPGKIKVMVIREKRVSALAR